MLILFVSDFDPEGDDVAHSFARSIRDDFGVKSVEAVKVALTSEQVAERNLIPLAKAKAGSSRRKKFVERHGSENVFELEALAPDDLQGIIRTAIESAFDMTRYRSELAAEEKDAACLEAIRRTMANFMATNFKEFAPDDEE